MLKCQRFIPKGMRERGDGNFVRVRARDPELVLDLRPQKR
jgi:hypothetical protein